MDRKQVQEQAIFKVFLKHRNISSALVSIESRSSPEPDILYKNELETIAFELVELCSPELAKNINDNLGSEEQAFIRVKDPSISTLKKKLSKKYNTIHSVELLIYTNGRAVTPGSLIIENLRPIIEVKEISFSKIWLLGDNLHLLYKNLETQLVSTSEV